MLPPGTRVLDNNPFFFFDLKKTNNNSSMNTTHYHNFYEIYLLLSGSCEYLINDKIYSISECSMLFVPAGEVHKTTYTSLHCERILLSFNDLIFDKYLSQELQKPLFYKLKENDPILDLFNKMSKITDFKSVKNQILIRGFVPKTLEPQCLFGMPLDKNNIDKEIINATINILEKLLKNKAKELIEKYKDIDIIGEYL